VKQRQSENRKGKGIGPRSKEWKKNISKANKGRVISWKSKISDSLKIFAPNRQHNPHAKPILQYDLQNILIAKYNSAQEAGRCLGNKSGNSIADCASGRQKTAYGYKWQWG
jgi:hypothetical protein